MATEAGIEAPAGLVPTRGELIAFGKVMDRALEALTAALGRAEAAEAARATAETELGELADRLNAVIRSAAETGRERAEAAEAEVARLRALLGGHGRAEEAEEYLTPGLAARRLGVRTETLTVWVREGRLAAVQPVPGGRRLYLSASVEALRRDREGGGS
jgi:excisionase family DNA binding protein